MAGLHEHHDHVTDECVENNIGRFHNAIICDMCNSADGAAVRKLKITNNFSFSPEEIRQFIVSTPHATHKIDFNKALEIYQSVKKGGVLKGGL